MHHTQPLISVIIPCYNTATYLPETIESVLNQTHQDFEIIAINDGSTDDTLNVLQKYANEDKRIKIIDQENTYFIVARINGIKQAQGTYLFCLDSDDKLHPTYFEKCLAAFSAQPELSAVYSKTQCFGNHHHIIKTPDMPTIKEMLLRNCSGVGPSMMIKKSTYEEIGGFDTTLTFGEDWDLYISLFKHNKKIYRIPEILFFYRKRANASSICDTTKSATIAENFLKIYTKHFDFYAENGLYLQDFFAAQVTKQKYYQNPLRKWFYKTFKPKKYQTLCERYDIESP